MASLKVGNYQGQNTVFDTGLNSLANNGRVLSSEINNSSDKYYYVDLELKVTYGTGPTAGNTVDLYLISSQDDGTTYPDGDSSNDAPANTKVASFPLKNNTSAQIIPFRGVPLPPGKHKYLIKNTSGQTMAASGNYLKRNSWMPEIA